ncbi:MAG TPA: HDOD domain-containing protein [Fimbriimonas sp.]|nr:HDOD domain-containing protein [Fimbriimonas sp.]
MSLRVLFVDDEVSLRSAMSRLLAILEPSWEVVTAGDGEEAMALLRSMPADAVVSDMRMPKMTGDKLLERVQEIRPSAARILLTGHAEASTGLRSISVAHRFLVKPCAPETLIDAVKVSCSLRKLLSSSELADLVGGASALPSAPAVFLEFIRELDKPNPCMQRIGSIIGSDVALTAKVLQLVNSSFFGLGRAVVSPSQAAAYLGLTTLRSLVAMVASCSEVGRAVPSKTVEELQHHSLAVGMLCRNIAQGSYKARCSGEDALLAGMMHDIGKLLLPDPKARDESHAEAGAFLLGLWGLPDQIVEAVAFHHRPDEAPSAQVNLATCVHAADAIVRQREGAEMSEQAREILSKIGLLDESGELLGEYQAA